ncbi:MAG: HAMP domain-containing histidine kinase, partial [Bacteroidia bacterium]|nr:HAMP domain-containing histidine kinase [Bacteroidia bacterium]
SLTGEVFLQKQAELKARISDERILETEAALVKKKQHSRIAMIIGEGSVFIILLSVGIYRVKKSFQKETLLAKQQKNFMLSVTHELKTPLAAIKLNLQTIQLRDLEKQKQQELIANCLRETDRLNQLIENVLLAARLENSELSFHKEKLNLTEFLEQHLRTTFNDARIEKKITSDIFVNADKIALSSLISNLIENALKYSEKNIIVSLFLKDGSPCLQVEDQGAGIPEAEKENVFKKFYRLGNEETRRTKGTGLGLFIVKFIAEQHNISIKLTDNTPKGSVFQLIFADGNSI